jgi:hypothetical protein
MQIGVQPVAGANRLWRFCFPTSRDSRRESAVAQFFSLGVSAFMSFTSAPADKAAADFVSEVAPRRPARAWRIVPREGGGFVRAPHLAWKKFAIIRAIRVNFCPVPPQVREIHAKCVKNEQAASSGGLRMLNSLGFWPQPVWHRLCLTELSPVLFAK